MWIRDIMKRIKGRTKQMKKTHKFSSSKRSDFVNDVAQRAAKEVVSTYGEALKSLSSK